MTVGAYFRYPDVFSDCGARYCPFAHDYAEMSFSNSASDASFSDFVTPLHLHRHRFLKVHLDS